MAVRRLRGVPWLSTETLLRFGLWSVLIAVVAYTRTDPDLWGHVRFGLDILQERTVPRADPYSFTTDRVWVNHEWAAEALTAGAFRMMGSAGLVFLKICVVTGCLLLLDRILRRRGVVGRRRDWIEAAAVVMTVQQAHHVRPQIFSLLFFSVLLTSLLDSSKRVSGWLLVIPALFGLWANFHGGWIVGGGVLILWTLGSAVRVADRSRAMLLVAVGVASMLASLANPYGVGLWRFLWETVGISRADITDWQPVYSLDASIWGLWAVTAVVASIGLVRETRVHPDAKRILVVFALGLGSFFVNRLLGFFALSTLFLFGHVIAGSLQPIPVTTRSAPQSGVGGMIAIAISFAMIFGGVVAFATFLRCVRVDERTAPEPEAMAVLKAQPGNSKLLVWFDWGEFAIWHVGPRMRVSIDGRRETVYSASLQQRHLRFFFDAPQGATLPEELGADYVWLPRQLPATRPLTARGWHVLYEGPTSVVFARPGLHHVATAATAIPSRRCFP